MRLHSKRAHPYARHVATLLEQGGFLDVQLEHEVAKALWHADGRSSVPFDISYLVPRPFPHREYVECKHKRRGCATAEDISKFAGDLKTCGLNPAYGLVVTNQGYEPGAIDRAHAAGIRLYVVPDNATTDLTGRVHALITHLFEKNEVPSTFQRIL